SLCPELEGTRSMAFLASLIWADLAQGPAARLAGQVVGPEGRPVASAEVVLVGWPSYQAPVVARGRTDDEGRFSLERPAGLAGEDRYRAGVLWVAAAGSRASTTDFAGALPGADEPVRVALEPAAKTQVFVEAPDGTPVSGARVSVVRIHRRTM